MKKHLLLILGLMSLSSIAQVDPAFANGFQYELDVLRMTSASAGMEATIILPGGCVLSATSGIQTGSTAIDSSKVFNLASNTKSLTATTILLMQEDGLLDIDDPVGMYINTSGWSGIDSAITIRSVLSHTSNLGDAWSSGSALWNAVWNDRDSVWNPRDVFLPQFQVAASGTPGDFDYNPFTGYTLLGFLIEEVSGNSFSTEVRNRIWTPLGLSKSKMSMEGLAMNEFNGVWSGSQDRSTWSHDSYLSTRGGGGSWCTSTREAAEYYHELHYGSLLSATSLTDMKTKVDMTPTVVPGFALGNLEVNYGLGSYIWTTTNSADTIIFYGHGGNGLATSISASCPQYGFTMVIASNDLTKVNEMGAGFISLAAWVIDELNAQTCSGISVDEMVSRPEFKLYPNPGSDILNLKGSEGIPTRYRITDILGSIINQGEFTGSTTLNTSEMTSGVYLVQCTNEDGSTTLRWVKE